VWDGVALVTVTGEIDMATVQSLRTVLSPLAADDTVRLVICDLSQVTFLGCIGVSTLLDTHAALIRRGARLHLVATAYVVLRPLAVLGLLDLLPVSPDVQTVLR
jgi:anti-anti-sigma factor